MKEGCECVLSFKKREEGPQRWLRDHRGHCQGFQKKPWGWGSPGGTTPVLTWAVSLKRVKAWVVPCWAMWVTLLPHKVQKGEHWAKEDYSRASRSHGICFAMFETRLGPVTPSFIFLPFGMRIWFHRFTAGEDFFFFLEKIFALWWIIHCVSPISDLDI